MAGARLEPVEERLEYRRNTSGGTDMKAVRFALTSLLSMALSGVAVAQDSAQVTGHIKAAKTLAGTEWPQVANLFCATAWKGNGQSR
jgi:hypothetical protein